MLASVSRKIVQIGRTTLKSLLYRRLCVQVGTIHRPAQNSFAPTAAKIAGSIFLFSIFVFISDNNNAYKQKQIVHKGWNTK